MKLKIFKFDNFKIPERKHYGDAGADCYSPADYEVAPHETIAIPLGFGIEIPNGYTGFIMPRTSMAKKGLIPAMCPIDTGYTGEVHAIITNTTNCTQFIHANDRIAQLVVFPVAIPDFVDDFGAERKDGAFGSTGK